MLGVGESPVIRSSILPKPNHSTSNSINPDKSQLIRTFVMDENQLFEDLSEQADLKDREKNVDYL